jgi:hypothetical protein
MPQNNLERRRCLTPRPDNVMAQSQRILQSLPGCNQANNSAAPRSSSLRANSWPTASGWRQSP